jgi:hypothetical protein
MTDLVQIDTTYTKRAVFEDGFGNPGSITSESAEVVYLATGVRTVIAVTVAIEEHDTGEYSMSFLVSDALFDVNKDYFLILSGITVGQATPYELGSFPFRPVKEPVTYSVDFS